MMEYTIYFSPNGEKRVKFEEGTDYSVNTDQDGREYFPIPNLYINNPENDPFKKLFNGRIKDAITAIRDGHGDVLMIKNLFGRSESVCRYIDREYGEEIRQKTIEGFKDTEFGFSLKFGLINSMNGNNFISNTKRILPTFDEDSYIFFDTEKEAEDFKEEIVTKAKAFADGWNAVKDDKSKLEKYFDDHFDRTVFARAGIAMLDEEENKENKWKIEIVQVMKPIAKEPELTI